MLGGVITGIAAWGFWVGVLVVAAVLVALTENERYGWATTTFACVFATLWLLGVFNIWKFTVTHPWALAEWFAAYIGGGIIWATIKWILYCKKELRKYNAAKADFLKARCVTDMTPELRVEWTEKLRNKSGYDRYTMVDMPVASQNKERIMNWLYLWPFSILGFVFADFLQEVWNIIYRNLGQLYDNIAKSIWKGVQEDLASEEDLQKARDAAIAATQRRNVAGRN